MNKQQQRCGKCENCKKLERVKDSVLRCCNPPFCDADDGVVAVWNDSLEHYPCTAIQQTEESTDEIQN